MPHNRDPENDDLESTMRSLETGAEREAARREIAVPATQRYLVGSEIARGVSSVIVRGHDELLLRDVALKILHPPPATDAERRRRFIDDARATAELDHPGIVPIHDIGELPDRRTFVSMRLLTAKPLSRVLEDVAAGRGEAPSLRDLLRAFVRVCETVSFAHARGVIHRDLHPDNLLIGPHGEVIVLDWGLLKWNPAQHLPPAGVLRQDNSRRPPARQETRRPPAARAELSPAEMARLVANLRFMSPEHVRGDGLDTRTDVYGLGAILYAILCGEAPLISLPGESTTDVLARVKSARRTAPSSRSGAPRSRSAPPWTAARSLETICMRALAIERDARYASATALMNDVLAYLEGNGAVDPSH